MKVFIQVFLPSVLSLWVVSWGYFKILKIAKEKNIVDNPDKRKLQKSPIPVLGGMAVFLGVIAGMLLGACIIRGMDALLPALLSMVVMLYLGFMDDTAGLTPLVRFVAEILTALGLIFSSGSCIDNFHGLWGIYGIHEWLAVPLTVFTCVGIINAVNMIDGVNGLSSGLCIVYSTLFGLIFVKSGDIPNAILAFSMAAGLMPFLLHNVFGKESKMFIGDAGTMVMGVVISWFVIVLLRDVCEPMHYRFNDNLGIVALCLAILSVPIFDTLRVMTMRMLSGRSPFSPDKTHLHHIFIQMGISHSITALSEILINLFVVAVWWIVYECGASVTIQLYAVLAASLLLVVGLYFFLSMQKARDTKLLHAICRFSIKTHLGHSHWWLRFQQFLDKTEE